MTDPDNAFFSDEIFGFHAQQAVEKSMKARLASLGVQYPKRHDLMVFINLLSDAGENVAGLYELVDLNPFGVQYRYESLPNDEEVIYRMNLLDKVEALFIRIEKLL